MVELATIRDAGSNLPGAYEDFPFDETTLTLKVGGKVFAFFGLDRPSVSLKAKPEDIVAYRERYDAILEAPYLNKKHWFMIEFPSSFSDAMLQNWLLNSYKLVIKGLTKSEREKLSIL